MTRRPTSTQATTTTMVAPESLPNATGSAIATIERDPPADVTGPVPVWLVRWWRWIVATLLLLHAGLGIHAAASQSVTHDEFWHLPVGLLTWKTGRFDFNDINPPLVRLLAALPLAASGVEIDIPPPGTDPSVIGQQFLRRHPENYDRLFFLGRLVIVGLSVITGGILAWWARRLFGIPSACLALLLWSLSPNVLAHASLVTTDIGLCCGFLATLASGWAFATRPGWKLALLYGGLLGLCQLTKFTAVILVPLGPLLWLALRWRNPRVVSVHNWRLVTGWWLTSWTIALLVLNAGYLFRGTASRLDRYEFKSSEMKTGAGILPAATPVLLPFDYVHGLDEQQWFMAQQHPGYLDGAWTTSGFRTYYLGVAAYKLTHVVQLLLVLAAGWICWPMGRARLVREQIFLLTPVALLLVIASLSHLQLGLRYVLPAFPLLFLFAGQGARWFDRARFPKRSLLLAVLVCFAPLQLRHHPQHLAYFNEFSGGPLEGGWHLLDSNLDWGQDLGRLRAYLRAEKIDDIGLAYFGTIPPGDYRLRYHLPPGRTPRPGKYAISVNYIFGRPHVLLDQDGKARAAGLEEFGYFRAFQPVARAGYSIWIYDLTPRAIQEQQRQQKRVP